jgi:hypothetical protein
MQIKIAERLRPFSHAPGAYFVLPGSFLRMQIFPALIRVHDLSDKTPKLIEEIPLNVKGPVKNFTIMLDLEKGQLCVFGHTVAGYMHYRIVANAINPRDYKIFVDKLPEILEKSFSDAFIPYNPPFTERLSLGNNKAQDLSLIFRRNALEEIFSLWLRLGRLIPFKGKVSDTQILSELLNNQPSSTFQNLFNTRFDQGISPRLCDEQHQGISFLSSIANLSSSLALLTELVPKILNLFIAQNQNAISILPHLPTEFHSGRLINFSCSDIGTLDLEWSKKIIRRMVLKATHTGKVNFSFQKDVKQFRLRLKENESGQILKPEMEISILPGQQLLFDRFEK